MSPLVELIDVGVRYGDRVVLDGVSLRVERGDFLGIGGSNGSGKTTLLRLVLGLAAPTAGVVRSLATSPAGRPAPPRVGYVPQRFQVDRVLPVTAAEIVGTGLVRARGWFGGRGRAARRRVHAALEQLGLAACSASRVRALSSGQQQRVLIARALVSDPEVLVLDEPTDSLDVEGQAALHALLRSLHRDRDVTVILVSHDLQAMSREVTTLAWLDRRLRFHGRPADALVAGGR